MYKLQVGFSRVDITPEVYGPMGGHGNDARRICTGISDRIYGSVIAITDETGKTVLFCPCDIIHARASVADPTREAISAATGIPFDQIMICASHNHAGPSISAPHLDAVQEYYRYFAKQLVKAAKEALADRLPAKAQIAQQMAPGMTFVRHYHMNDGTVAGPNSGSFASGVKSHVTDADDQLQLMRFVREGGRDVLLVNWQCHVTIGAGDSTHTIMTADYPSVMRNHVEGTLGCHCGFFQGAAGNLVPSSKIPGEAIVPHERVAYGTRLAEYVIECAEKFRDVEAGPIQVLKREYTGEIDHSDDHLAEKAHYVNEHLYDYPTAAERNKFVRDNGFNSFLHAGGVERRASMGATMSIDVYALTMGDIAFVTAPYEMFNSNGRFIKENSPYDMTFVCTCSNDTIDYLADITTFQYDCYEVNTRRMGAGTAEKVADLYVAMLKEMKE